MSEVGSFEEQYPTNPMSQGGETGQTVHFDLTEKEQEVAQTLESMQMAKCLELLERRMREMGTQMELREQELRREAELREDDRRKEMEETRRETEWREQEMRKEMEEMRRETERREQELRREMEQRQSEMEKWRLELEYRERMVREDEMQKKNDRSYPEEDRRTPDYAHMENRYDSIHHRSHEGESQHRPRRTTTTPLRKDGQDECNDVLQAIKALANKGKREG